MKVSVAETFLMFGNLLIRNRFMLKAISVFCTAKIRHTSSDVKVEDD